MVFSSLVFLYLYLPAVLVLHYVLPKKIRNAALLLVNLVFYGYGEPVYVFLMIASIIVNYTMGAVLYRVKTKKLRLSVLVLNMLLNLGALGWYKYAGLFADTLRHFTVFSDIPVLDIVLPIGISFYTFQAMSYVIDIYRKDTSPAENLIDFAAYISLFPQLIAGPIVRYSDVALQMKERYVTIEKFSWGIKMFCVGLAKKVLLANQFALLWHQVSANVQQMGTVWAWVAIIGYSLQIYFDFGGYSDMARGLGAMLGFDFCINFDYPYLSASITEFWRRWHISLSSWFRDYVYIPLGGSRRGTLRTICNLIIVWMLTGFWHGAGWNFLLWGFYYGALLIVEKFVLRTVLRKTPVLVKRLYALVLVVIGWVFFACPDLTSALDYLKVMFGAVSGQDLVQIFSWLPLLTVGILASTPAAALCCGKFKNRAFMPILEAVFCLAALVICTASLVSGSYNPFLYFRF